jgi:hypothetical protein
MKLFNSHLYMVYVYTSRAEHSWENTLGSRQISFTKDKHKELKRELVIPPKYTTLYVWKNRAKEDKERNEIARSVAWFTGENWRCPFVPPS